MCYYCTASQNYINRIELWADDGLACSRLTILARPSAEACPNTYVFVFGHAVEMGGVSRNVYIDVHYEGDTITPGAPRKAIGGLWIPGVQGAMKPEQHGGELRRILRAELPGAAPRVGIAGVYGDLTGTVPLPPGLSH